MTFPSDYYYLRKRSDTQFTDKPQRILDVGRMLQNKSTYWQKEAMVGQLFRKTIVIARPFLSSGAVEYRQWFFKKNIDELIADGFIVYLWQDGGLKKITSTCFSKNLKKVDNLTDHDLILKEASIRFKLPSDHILILDYSNITYRHILCKIPIDFTNPNPENANDSIHVGLIGLPPFSTYRLKTIFISDSAFEIEGTQTIKSSQQLDKIQSVEVLEMMNTNKILTDYVGLCDATNTIERLDLVDVSNTDQWQLDKLNFLALKWLTVVGAVDKKLLEKLLSSATNLEYIDISSFSWDLDFINFTSVNSKQLKALYLSSQYDTQSCVIPWLKTALKLELLSIKNSAISFATLRETNWSELKELDLTRSTLLDCPSLDKLLDTINTAKNIEKINLNGMKINGEDYSTKLRGSRTNVNIQFDRLTWLDVSSCTESSSAIIRLLFAAPNLEYLDLSHALMDEFFNPEINLETLKFPRLKTLNICNSNVEVTELVKHIVKSAPNLKSIDFRGTLFHDSLIWIADSDCNLSQLESLDLSKGSIGYPTEMDSGARNRLLQKTSNLRYLNLSGLSISSLTILPGQFQYLEFFSIEIDSEEQLLLILRQATNLRELNICYPSSMIFSSTLRALLSKINTVNLTVKSEPNDRFHGLNRDIPNNQPYGSQEKQPTQNNHAFKKTNTVDADTTLNPNKTFHLKRIFFSTQVNHHPELSSYRINIYNTVSLASHSNQTSPFNLSHHQTNDPTLIDAKQENNDVYQLASHEHYYGKQSFQLTHEWQPIASLTPNDKLTHYHVTPDIGIDIQYSTDDNLYFIRTTATHNQAQSVELDFLIQPELFIQPKLDHKLQTIVNQFKAFKAGQLVLKRRNPTSRDYLNAILEQKVGACRHRSVAFKLYMQEHAPEISVRIISNDCHMFVEIKQDKHWITVDFGGYPAQQIIDDSAIPKFKPNNLTPAIAQPIQYPNSEQNEFQYLFNTWEIKTKSNHDNLLSFINHLFTGSKKQLIQLPATASLSFINAIQSQAINTSHPVFYIHSPDDLVCSAPYIQRTLDTGVIHVGPGGSLHDFLTIEPDNSINAPVLIVNYTQFSAQDIVNFNSLLDTQRYADGTPVPEDLILIGVMDRNQPGSYQGGDFYSRLDEIDNLPINLLPHSTPIMLPVSELDTNSARSIINLYHSTAWKTRLLGSWILCNGQLHYETGVLVEALEKNLPIEIQNPPEDEEFKLFWQQLRLHMQARINLPNFDLSSFPYDCPPLFSSEGYAWLSLLSDVTWVQEPKAHFMVINSSVFNQFFSHYEYQQEELNLCEGLLSQSAKKNLSLYLTHALNQDQWAMLLDESKKHQVQLSIALAPNLTLPDYFNQNIPIISRSSITPTHHATRVIYTPDRDLTLAKLKQDDNSVVLDISEASDSDLIYKLDGRHIVDPENPELRKLSFNQNAQVLTVKLQEGKTVILTGQWSDELIESLAPMLFQRIASPETQCSGKLILITERPMDFISAIVTLETATADEKQQALCLAGATPDDLKRLQDENAHCFVDYRFIQLRTRLRFIKSHPVTPSNQAWYGLDNLPSLIKLETFNPATSKHEASAFQEKRKLQVDQALAQAPFVFLAGLTGVGKTSFVKQYYQHDQSILFMGNNLNRLIQWATDDNDADKILFIDEANLSPRQWSEFEGLFNDPPSIVINGQYYPLTKKHRVIFAGNPLSYGDDRILASLFARHGNAIVFDPLPTAFVYEEIIKPVFKGSRLTTNQIEIIAIEILAVYNIVASCSGDEVLISPREVQMMALLINQYLSSNPTANIKAVAKYYAHTLGRPLVPASHLAEFDQQFPTPQLSKATITDKKTSHSAFFITPSREVIRQQLHDLISLRDMRRKTSDLNETQLYGGICGLIIEGEPGIGKSDLVIQYLLSQGFIKASPAHESSYQEQVYYSIPVSMKLDTKKKLLLKAFHEGAVVLIDEINSAPMIEQLLNSLLMGQTPEGARPKRPGFIIIGTQNPIHMAGRTPPSNALARRMITASLPPYSKQEILDILNSKGMPLDISQRLFQAYQNACIEAKTKGLSPAPNFRNLIKAAEHWIKGQHSIAVSPANHPIVGALPAGPRLEQGLIDDINQQFNNILDLYQLKVIDLQTKSLNDSNYISIAQATETLSNQLTQRKAAFLQDPTLEAFQQLKDDSCFLIEEAMETAPFNQHRGLLYRTPILRELTQFLRGIINLIQLIALKPIYVLTNNKNPVFKEGLYQTFFHLPNTETFDKTQALKEDIKNIKPP